MVTGGTAPRTLPHLSVIMLSATLLRHVSLGFALILALSGCNYLKLGRPNVIGQLHPDLVGLVNFLPSIDRPNEATLGMLIGTGGLKEANRDSAGYMRARVRVPRDQFIWRPSVVVMPEGGVLELSSSASGQNASNSS